MKSVSGVRLMSPSELRTSGIYLLICWVMDGYLWGHAGRYAQPNLAFALMGFVTGLAFSATIILLIEAARCRRELLARVLES